MFHSFQFSGFQVETPMLFGALLGRDSGISYSATRRDDHPGQAEGTRREVECREKAWLFYVQ